MTDPTKTVTNPRIAKLIQYEDKLDTTDAAELKNYRDLGLAPKKAGSSLTEAQGKATGFYGRALEADKNFNATLSSVQPRPYIAYKGAETAPDLANTQASPDRQLSEQAKRNFILASLRYESGASINADEFSKQERAFFPMPGDAPATIAQKAHDRKVVIQGLSEGSGPGADAMGNAAPSATDYSKELSGKFEPYQAQLYSNFREANPKATPAQLKEFADAIGTTLADSNAPTAGAKVEVPILEAGSANILGPSTGKRATIDIHDQTTAQSPEFRAGLAKLLSDPSVSADQIRDYWSKNAKGDAVPADAAQAEAAAPLAVERGKNGVTDRIDSAIRGAADTASLGFADEIAAGADTIFGDKTMAENLAAERGVDTYDQQNHGIMRFLGQLGGAAVLPVGRATSAADLARTGGIVGAGYGFGSTNGSLGDRFIGAGIGGVTGAAGGYGVGKLGERFVRGGTPPAPPGGAAAADVARAANEEGVPVSRPILDPGKRDKMAYLESSVGSGNTIREGLEGTRSAIEQRAAKLGEGGTPDEPGAFGQRVQGAMDRWMKSSKRPLTAAYDKAAEMAGDNPVYGKEAVAKLDEQIADLSRNPNTNKAVISYLQDVRGDLVDANGNLIPKKVGDIRDIRTNLRGDINTRNLTHTPAERLVGEALDAARNDISRDLGQSAPEAERLFRETDIRYKLRAREIKQVVEKVIGPDDNRISGGDVMARVNSLARNDTPRLTRLWNKLSPQEQLDGAATVADTAGRMAPDEPFSPGRFINWSRGIKPSAREVVFGPEGAKSIENLRVLSRAYQDTVSRLNNSRSGVVANWGRFLGQITSGGTLGTLVGGVPGTVAGAAAGTVLSGVEIAARNISARALMSRDLSRWLAVAPTKTTAQSVQSWIGKLSQVAVNDPAIAKEALGLQKALMSAVNDNASTVGRAAASPDEAPAQSQQK